MTTVRLNDEIDTKLVQLKDIEKTTKTEIIKKAISEYYDHHVQSKTPFELGENLFGRVGGDPDLSQNYKIKLKEKLNEKYSN